ncbi:MAG: hypothetical protein HZC13_07795 [Nitrospirae bacterium]|nr:hypothetical protein [Nitrospirota bacterium]MBI5406071.1 hypothetical protein [Nitrospirota bacterium]
MKKLLLLGLSIVLSIAAATPSIAEEQNQTKRGVGPAPFYLSVKDKIGISKEQEDKLMAVEKEAIKKLEALTPSIIKAQQALNAVTKEEEVDLKKVRELLNNIVTLETDGKFTVIEAMALENKVLTKDQRDKAKEIALSMSKAGQAPPAPPVKK